MQRPDLDTLACVNTECQLFHQPGASNLVIRKVYGHDRMRLLRCRTCGEEFSERRGTALFNTKLPEPKAEEVINHLDEGCSVRATARLVHVAKETVARLLRVTGRHAERFHDQHVRGLTPRALEFDEQWSFVKKKQKRCQDHETEVAGDWWDHTAVAADSKLVVSLVVGKRTHEQTQALVTDAKRRLRDGHLPAIFTDAYASYESAILEAFGRRYPLRAQGRASRSVLRWPQGLAYGQVKKHDQKGRVERIEVRARYGKARLKHVLSLLGYTHINTSVVERHNGTSRLRNQRKVRKTLAFSKAPRYHRWMSWLSVGLYNFCRTHSSLKSMQDTQVQHRSPAMAARLTNHIWSTREWLLCPVVGG